MAQQNQESTPQGQTQEQAQQNQNNQQLSQADKQVYEEIFQSLNKIDKKVQTAKNRLQNNQSAKKQEKNINFKEIAQKLIESKQNSQIVNKQDLLTDINQSFERAVIDIYSQNQQLKKKQIQMEKIIKQQNHKIFEQHTKQQNLIKQLQKLRFQLAQSKDHQMVVNRGVSKAQSPQDNKKQTAKRSGLNKAQNSQSNQDYDFWNMPQNDNYNKKKKQFVQNSGLWVNQKNIGQSMFITQGRK